MSYPYGVHIAKLKLYIYKYSMIMRVLDVYNLIVLLESLYEIVIGFK